MLNLPGPGRFFSRYRLRLYLLVLSLTGMALGLILLLGLDEPAPPSASLPDGQARVYIVRPPQGIIAAFASRQNTPAALLAQAGVQVAPGETLRWNGLPVGLGQTLPPAAAHTLQIQPLYTLTVIENGQPRTFQSSAATILQALWHNGGRLASSDSLSAGTGVSPLQPLAQAASGGGPLILTVQRARALRVQTAGQTITVYSAAPTVGEALAESGFALHGLDTSRPADDQPLPEDGVIEVVRVREELRLEQTVLPFEVERRADPAANLGVQVVLEQGQNGLEAARMRLRFEDGREASRPNALRWALAQPKKQVETYGTKIVTGSIDTEAGSLQYWRAVEMYATSYYPCGFKSGCNDRTASGQTLRKGIVAVSTEWYAQLAGYRVYVPGYGIGTIADTGGGIPGKKWIDLGYGNDDYVGWSKNVTVYFLNPPPPVIPWFLQ